MVRCLQTQHSTDKEFNKQGASKLSATGRMTLTASTTESSPFYVPEDSEIFRMKEKQKDRKKEQRLRNQNLKIWEKGNKQKDGLTMKQLNQMAKAAELDDQAGNPTKISLIEAAKSAIKNRVKSTQPMHEFIDKKREMLLFQMLIDHKRQQINEFEELTRLHRKGLERAEHMLEEDMQAFNEHLNQNKRDARKKIKEAEQKTRDKNQKVAIIKERLEVKADLTGKNTSKMETLESLKTYKDFLDGLNPQLTEEQRRVKQERRKANKKTISNSNLNISPQIMEFLLDEQEEEQMYFKDPAQLVNIFLNLQESNLFLITNLKSIEQSIEVVKTSFAQKRKVLDAKNAQLLKAKVDIVKQMAQVQKEIEHIKISTNKDDYSNLFTELETDIVSMYKQYGEKVLYDQKNVSGLELLKEMEKRLETQVKTINEFRQQNSKLLGDLEKMCFNEKREKKKLKNEEQLKELALQQKIQDAPKKEKRIGRPIMAKSKLKVEEKEEKVEDEGPKEEEIERRKYLT